MSCSEMDMVSRILKQTIIAMCRETVSFDRCLEIDGIICIKTDNKPDSVVKIHETVEKHVDMPNTADAGIDAAVDSNSSSSYTVQKATLRNTMQTVSSGNSSDVGESVNGKHIISNSNEVQQIKSEASIESLIDTNQASNDNSRHVIIKGRVVKLEMDTNNEQKDEHVTPGISQNTETLIKVEKDEPNDIKQENLNNATSDMGLDDSVCMNQPDNIDHLTTSQPDNKEHLTTSQPDNKKHLTTSQPDNKEYLTTSQPDNKEHLTTAYSKTLATPKGTPKQKFSCQSCSFSNINWLIYNKHALVHGPRKTYICTHCEISYTDPFAYTTHLRKHKGDEMVTSFGCCFCDLPLPSFYQFQRHEHSHVNDPHTCDICGKQFAYMYRLNAHILKHKNKSDPANKVDVQNERIELPSTSADTPLKRTIDSIDVSTDSVNAPTSKRTCQTKPHRSKANTNTVDEDNQSLHGETGILTTSHVKPVKYQIPEKRGHHKQATNVSRDVYETNTQTDEIMQKEPSSVYEDQTQSDSCIMARKPKIKNQLPGITGHHKQSSNVSRNVYETNTQTDEIMQKRSNSIYEDQTQQDDLNMVQNPKHTWTSNEKSVVDNRGYSSANFTQRTPVDDDENAVFTRPRDRRARILLDEDESENIHYFGKDQCS